MTQPISHLTTDVIIIGAGPAGLTAAYELSKAGKQAVIFEKAALVIGPAGSAVIFDGK